METYQIARADDGRADLGETPQAGRCGMKPEKMAPILCLHCLWTQEKRVVKKPTGRGPLCHSFEEPAGDGPLTRHAIEGHLRIGHEVPLDWAENA